MGIAWGVLWGCVAIFLDRLISHEATLPPRISTSRNYTPDWDLVNSMTRSLNELLRKVGETVIHGEIYPLC